MKTREYRLQVRLDDNELASVQGQAESLGLNMSQYVRWMVGLPIFGDSVDNIHFSAAIDALRERARVHNAY